VNGCDMTVQEASMSSLLAMPSASQQPLTRHASLGPMLISFLVAASLMLVVEALLVLAWMLEKGWCVCQLVFLL
jgi:hypothetical protein